MKLALKGHTLVFASGDYGVGQKPPFTVIDGEPWTNGCKSHLCVQSHVVYCSCAEWDH